MAIEKNVLTISELTRQIKGSLETNFPRVWIEGEVSNFKQHTSGHLYFTLKDEGAQISAVLWRSRVSALTVFPEDGMKIIARGSITVYPPRGNYQIDVDQIQPCGIGELQLAFEKLKKKLAAEGLFDTDHKKLIPEFPESIGIVTSETGAALQDIRSVLSRRNPAVDVFLIPVRVQGVGAAEEIVDAIRKFNYIKNVDVIIVGRGGGSLEDLWAFNEEIVARAIYDSEIPIISAVGHEIDFSITDFAADLRAPTPSAAAEMVVRDRTDLLEDINNLCYTMQRELNKRMTEIRSQISNCLASYGFNRPYDLVREYSQHSDELDRSLNRTISHTVNLTYQRFLASNHQLQTVNPQNVLKRGYTIIKKGKRIVPSARLIHRGESAQVQFHDGLIDVEVKKGHEL
jgi:exodeoxyribonuclease VII large subunit